jgi:putative transposase
MQENRLVSKYTREKYRINTEKSNEATASNHLNRQFTAGQQRKVFVTDLNYVRVKQH